MAMVTLHDLDLNFKMSQSNVNMSIESPDMILYMTMAMCTQSVTIYDLFTIEMCMTHNLDMFIESLDAILYDGNSNVRPNCHH